MIPAYNRTKYLEKTLRSVLSQDPGADVMQIEVVDDASSVDDPEPIVRRVGGERVSFVRNPRNLGLMPNFNNCIQRSQGFWVHILHTDDFVLPGFYERLKTALEHRSDVGAAFCRFAFVDENDRWQCASGLERPTPGILPDSIGKIGSSVRIQFPSIAVRRSVYERLGGFRLDLPYAADWEMWVRIAAHYPIWYEPTTLAAFRGHSASASADFRTSGEDFADLRRCIEVSRAWLPPNRAETISRSAREFACLASIPETCPDDLVLRRVEELISISRPGPASRSGVANAFLRAAQIHYRQGRRLRALAFLARAIITRPIVAGRPLKRLLRRGADPVLQSSPNSR
jgi:hypothetical protein